MPSGYDYTLGVLGGKNEFRLVDMRWAVPLGFRARGQHPALVFSSTDINRDFQNSEVAQTSWDTTQRVPTYLLSGLLLAGTVKWSSRTVPPMSKSRKMLSQAGRGNAARLP